MKQELKEFYQILLTNTANGSKDIFTIFYTDGKTATIEMPNNFGIKSIIRSDVGDYYTITFLNGETADVAGPGIEDYMTHHPAFKKYGVSGIGQQTAALTRTEDAVGMTAEVGTDDTSVSVTNDFDTAYPFMHKKCVGNWTMGENGYPKFNVQAYLGEEGYAEDGTKGDYVAVELPKSYYYMEGSTLIVSGHRYEGYKCFDIFLRDHDKEMELDKIYVPAYALALKDGKAVSLPGLDNDQGDYATLFKNARKYSNNDVNNKAMLMPAALEFYYWALAVVEFANQNVQYTMCGMADLRNDQNSRCKFLDATHILVTDWTSDQQSAIASWNANWRKAGDYVAILTTNLDINHQDYKATHRIVSVTRCDNSGTADASGQYSKIEIEDLGKNYFTYDTTGATDYKIAGRPYPTGACNDVVTPSGSPASNSDGHHPMRYRYRENVWGNQYHTSVDLFDIKVGTGDSDYELEYYYLPDPSVIGTPSNPTDTALKADPYEKLGVKTKHANYANGFIKSREYDEKYPDIWIPDETTGGSETTYFADYANLVNSPVVRSVRFGGHWNNGGNAGFMFYGSIAPSSAHASFGGDLCFAQ